MIGVVIPAHNEQGYLEDCLRAVLLAASHPALLGETVRIVVVLDSCTDGSAAIALAHPVTVLTIDARNVGAARWQGAQELMSAGARWLAFTDADSMVSENWLVDQLALGADAVCGCVTVDDWSDHSELVRSRYHAHYQDRDGHRHVHGANLGVSARAYGQCGGFSRLALGEDVALVDALIASGANVVWSARPRVTTSARKVARAAGGFSHFLLNLADDGNLAA